MDQRGNQLITSYAIKMKPGIRILDDQPGDGAPVQQGERIRIRCGLSLNRGDHIQSFQEEIVLGNRHLIAGLHYGIEGMRIGGRRRFKASAHLCYGADGVPGKIPPNAALVFDVDLLET